MEKGAQLDGNNESRELGQGQRGWDKEGAISSGFSGILQDCPHQHIEPRPTDTDGQ